MNNQVRFEYWARTGRRLGEFLNLSRDAFGNYTDKTTVAAWESFQHGYGFGWDDCREATDSIR